MKPAYLRSRIADNIEISHGIFKLTVRGCFTAKPGQFYMLRAWGIEPLLPRPVSIHDIDEDKLSFIYEVKGEGTRILSKLKIEDEIELLGPLGSGFDVGSVNGRVAVVTGGIGIAPMLYAVKKTEASSIDLYAGFRNDVFIVDDFRKNVDNVYISTDSGKEGHKGFITEIFSPLSYSMVLCCGPEVMMEKVVKKCIEHDVPVYVSMEKHMACGIGACLVCTCNTREGKKRVCKDGPVFWGRDVITSD